MEKDFGQADPDLADYAEEVFQPQDDILREVVERTLNEGLPPIQVGPMDGLHLEVLTRAAGVKTAVEFGALGGYSGICIARGLAEGGRLYTLEIDPHHADVARAAYELAGVADRVEVIVGPAVKRMLEIEHHGPFDLVFIDADKDGYPIYLDWAGDNLRIGGLVLADNTFAWGSVTHKNPGPSRAIRKLNQVAASGGRFRSTILPTGEGLTMGVKIK